MLNLDARQTTHPIRTRIDNEEQAAGAFDAITYVKGQGFLRMLEAYVGESKFRKGIRSYIAAHRYSNTTTADLWTAIEAASGKPVAKLAADWTTQPGFPPDRRNAGLRGRQAQADPDPGAVPPRRAGPRGAPVGRAAAGRHRQRRNAIASEAP